MTSTLAIWHPVTTCCLETYRIWWGSDRWAASRSLVTFDLAWHRWKLHQNLPWDEMDACAKSVLSYDKEWSRPLPKGLLFLGSFISSLCLVLVLSVGLKMHHSNWHKNNLCAIKIHELKSVARLVIRRDLRYALPLCMIFKCGQFHPNPTWDTAEIVSLKIILDVWKGWAFARNQVVERHAQYVNKKCDFLGQIH